MATKIESIQAKAKRQLDKIIPFDQWVELRERTEEEKKIYKQTVETLQNILDGKNEVYDTIITTIKNGKTTSRLK